MSVSNFLKFSTVIGLFLIVSSCTSSEITEAPSEIDTKTPETEFVIPKIENSDSNAVSNSFKEDVYSGKGGEIATH